MGGERQGRAPRTGRAPRSGRAAVARALCVGVTVALGLATRKAPGVFPAFVAEYGGDALYATLWVQLLGALAWWRGRGPGVGAVALTALSVCFLVEGSQAVDVGWLAAARATRLGALVLGRGFLVSDLGCYAVGAGLGGLVERALRWL